MTELLIFASQFIAIYLLGLQSLMVRDDNKLGAASGSLMIGVVQFYVLAIIGDIGVEAIGTPKYYAFLSAGPLAIVTSMYTHPYINKHVFRRH